MPQITLDKTSVEQKKKDKLFELEEEKKKALFPQRLKAQEEKNKTIELENQKNKDLANKHYEALKAQFPETFEKCFFHISEKREMTKKQEAYYKGILPSNIQFFVYASVFYESKFRCGIYDEGSFSISISIKKFLSMNYVELQDYYRSKRRKYYDRLMEL